MDFQGGPLDDAFNPPARYLLESDSEDELGDDISSVSRRRSTEPKDYTISSDVSKSYSAGGEMHLIVCIGLAAQRVMPSLSGSDTAKEVDVKIGDISVAAFATLSPTVSLLSVSSTLPVTTHSTLSRWIIDTVAPTRLTIIDVYPIPNYIESKTTIPSRLVRYLRTSPSGPHADSLPSKVQSFAPPNLLSTQTLSSSLLCLVQQSHLAPNTTLRQPTLLLLLPYPHIQRMPPRTLTHDAQYTRGGAREFDNLQSIWTLEDMQVVYQALDIEHAGVTFVPGGHQKSNFGVNQTKSRHSMADNSMYI
ncbi:hypothetical protein FRB93_001381 [Tulasnella sp. JGI-2019a]|nr:hypothetical protein FRB93_001381 [Tulasnella sp. JGI-2019a]